MTLKNIFKDLAVTQLHIFVIIYELKYYLIIKIKILIYSLVALRNDLYLIVRKININLTRIYVKIDWNDVSTMQAIRS